MAIRYYDQAIVDKIQKWIKDPNMLVLKPNEVSRLWQIRADQTNDKPLTLPLIAISRESRVSLENPNKKSLSCNGLKLESTEYGTIQLNAIPLNLSYQIDIYTQKYEEGDEYLRNFTFNFVNHPQMSIMIPYRDINIEHICYARLQPDLVDNSDISEKVFPDQFTRWTLTINVTDAFLFSVPFSENAKLIGADLVLADSSGDIEEVIETIENKEDN